MAGEWIKMRNNLWTHPKVAVIGAKLDVMRATVIGALHGVWALADEHAEDDRLDMTPDLIDTVVDVPGIAKAMIDVGWLEEHDGYVVFPDYEEHNGSTAKRRAYEQKRKQQRRWEKTQGASRPQSVRKVSASDADKLHTRGEERREEKSKTPCKSPKGDERVSVTDADAEAVYQAYPRKVGKDKAHRKIKQAVRKLAKREDDPLGWLLDRTRQYASAVKSWPEDQRRFIPHPATWFNQGRYDDDPSEWRGPPDQRDRDTHPFMPDGFAEVTDEILAIAYGDDED